MEGPDCSDGFTLVDFTDCQEFPTIGSMQMDIDTPVPTGNENSAVPLISPPGPPQQVISESDAESELRSPALDKSARMGCDFDGIIYPLNCGWLES